MGKFTDIKKLNKTQRTYGPMKKKWEGTFERFKTEWILKHTT